MSLFPSVVSRLVRRRIALCLMFTAFFTYGYFCNGVDDPNSTTRLALAVTMVESHHLTIDDYAVSTIDKAFYNGHYYADKAPGMSFMATPIVAAALPIIVGRSKSREWFNRRPVDLQFTILDYLVELLTSALPTALTVGALFLAGLRIARPAGALFAAIAFGWCTPAWGWSTTVFEHAATGAFLFFALLGVTMVTQEQFPPMRRRYLIAFATGLLMGWNVVVELIAVPALVIIAFFGLWRLRFAAISRAQKVTITLLFLLGGAIGVLPLLLYDSAAFGSPFGVGYGHIVGFQQMHSGFFGIHLPSPRVLLALIIGRERGVLWLSPILIITPWALYRLYRRRHGSEFALVCAAISIYYLLLNAGYVYWNGGWSTGPRLITPIYAFVCLPLATLWDQSGPRMRIFFAALLVVSLLLSLVCAMVGMTTPPQGSELFDHLLPMLFRGAWGGIFIFQLQRRFWLHLLPPTLTLLPLLLIWEVAALAWLLWIRGSDGHLQRAPVDP